jgi:hypothetical protein
MVISYLYDDAATVYADLLTRLNAAIPKLTDSGFGASDPIYAGNLLGKVW